MSDLEQRLRETVATPHAMSVMREAADALRAQEGRIAELEQDKEVLAKQVEMWKSAASSLSHRSDMQQIIGDSAEQAQPPAAPDCRGTDFKCDEPDACVLKQCAAQPPAPTDEPWKAPVFGKRPSAAQPVDGYGAWIRMYAASNDIPKDAERMLLVIATKLDESATPAPTDEQIVRAYNAWLSHPDTVDINADDYPAFYAGYRAALQGGEHDK